MERMFSWNWRAIGFGGILEDNEQIQKVYRQAFFFFGQKISGYLVISGGAAGVSWYFLPLHLWWISLVIFGLGMFKVASEFCFWYANAILMTDLNLVVIQWPRPFIRKCVRIDYWNLDEIQVERLGIGSFFHNYGTLHFQKINGGELLSVSRIKSPHKVANEIEKYKEEMVDMKSFSEASTLKDLLAQLVQTQVKGGSIPNADIPLSQTPPKPKNPAENAPTKERSQGALKKWLQKKKQPAAHHPHIEIEKKLDDDGGIEIDLDTHNE